MRSAAIENQLMHDEDRIESKKAPTGFVTIMFTEIQSASRLWEACPAAMKKSVLIHNNIIRELLKLYNGYLVKEEDSAFMISFEFVQSAMEFSMSLQLRLMNVTWDQQLLCQPEASDVHVDSLPVYHGLRVRVAFNCGEPNEADSPNKKTIYFGPVVALVSRLIGTGKGGETVVGNNAMGALKRCGALPSKSVVVRVCGPRLLKGITKEETISHLLPRKLSGRKDVSKREGDGQFSNVWNQLPTHKKRVVNVIEKQQQIYLLGLKKKVPKLMKKICTLHQHIEIRENTRMQEEDGFIQEVPPVGKVALVYTEIHPGTQLFESDDFDMTSLLQQHNLLVRNLLSKYQSYEIKSHQGSFMILFNTVTEALDWCVTLQCQLLTQAWPIMVLAHRDIALVYGKTGDIIFSGPRVRMGIDVIEPNYIHETNNGRSDLLSEQSDPVSSLAGSARAGEILVGNDAFEELQKLDEIQQGSIFRHLSSVAMTQATPTGDRMIHSVIPNSLIERRELWDSKVSHTTDNPYPDSITDTMRGVLWQCDTGIVFVEIF